MHILHVSSFFGTNMMGELHREELQKVQEDFWKAKEEFGVALAGVRHELQTLTDSPTTPQSYPEACSPNHHDEILCEIQSLRKEISVPAPTGHSEASLTSNSHNYRGRYENCLPYHRRKPPSRKLPWIPSTEVI